MLPAVLGRELTVMPRDCGFDGKLTPTAAFGLFQDIATLQADALGIGFKDLGPKGLFWIVAKTRVRIRTMPGMLDQVTLKTWPEIPDKFSCNRDYVLSQNGRILAEGLTQWAVMDLNNNRLIRTDQLYPEGFEALSDRNGIEGFTRIRDRFTEEVFGSYRVLPTDIDLGNHMNNVKYVNAVLSLIPVKDRLDHPVKELEIHYEHSAHEGDVILFQKQAEEDGSILFRGGLEDGTTILLGRIVRD